MTNEADWIAAGLLDPGQPDADERRELLRYLSELGVSIPEMVVAHNRRGLGTAATDQLLHAPGGLTLADAADAAGLAVPMARRVLLAAGFAVPGADEPVLGDGDVQLLQVFGSVMPRFGEEAVLAFTRVIGASLARIAEAADAMFLTEVESPMRASGGTSTDVARSARQGLELLLGLPAVMEPMFRHHVADAVIRSRAARGGGLIDRFLITVGFADLVGSTALAGQVDASGYGASLADFEQRASDLATTRGVRLVKAIGDEVMVAGSDPVAVVDVLVAIAAYVAGHPILTQIRAAAARGELEGRGGDWFGPAVNIASRSVKEAEPGQVVVTAEVAHALAAAGRSTQLLGERQLRGVPGSVLLHAVTEPVGGDPTGDG